MKEFITITLLTTLSIQSLGQASEPLPKNNWIEKQLKISDIKKSKNDVDLRIFLDRGITNGGHVVRIIKRNNSWTGTMYDYLLKENNGKLTKRMTKVTKTELKSSDWDFLWTQLEQLDILTLPNQMNINEKLSKEVLTKRGKGYEVLLIADGSSYDLAVKKGDVFSNYSFNSPEMHSQKYPDVEEVRKYNGIISVLENEFKIKFR